ncbi:MAG: type II toxin-antitoxin system VapC family toxin, partial [Egibacteraceae bacterium]
MTAVVVDTSAAFAVLAGEAGGDQLADSMGTFQERLMSAATLVELGIVFVARFGPSGTGLVERFLREGEVDVVSVDRD